MVQIPFWMLVNGTGISGKIIFWPIIDTFSMITIFNTTLIADEIVSILL